MNTPQGKLYLIPVPIAEVEHSQCLPELNRALLPTIRHFIVENIRSARRFLKAADRSVNIDALTFYELNKHTPEGSIESFLTPIEIENLPYAVALFPYMQAIRFLADYLNGDTYFKVQHPLHNLERTCNQFRLLECVEEATPKMEAYIQEKLAK